MTEPYDVTGPADRAQGLRRFVDRTGREWTEEQSAVSEPTDQVKHATIELIRNFVRQMYRSDDEKAILLAAADTIEQLTRERDAYLALLTPESPGGLWYAATGRMDPFVVSWTAMELDGPWHDRNEAVAAVRRLAGLDAASADVEDRP